jgi:hypothetical protein
MNNHRPILEPVLATGATVTSAATWAAEAHAWIQILVGLATLAWWLRLWVKNPNLPPPGSTKEEKK